jgi:hypothetical protein
LKDLLLVELDLVEVNYTRGKLLGDDVRGKLQRVAHLVNGLDHPIARRCRDGYLLPEDTKRIVERAAKLTW